MISNIIRNVAFKIGIVFFPIFFIFFSYFFSIFLFFSNSFPIYITISVSNHFQYAQIYLKLFLLVYGLVWSQLTILYWICALFRWLAVFCRLGYYLCNFHKKQKTYVTCLQVFIWTLKVVKKFLKRNSYTYNELVEELLAWINSG